LTILFGPFGFLVPKDFLYYLASQSFDLDLELITVIPDTRRARLIQSLRLYFITCAKHCLKFIVASITLSYVLF